VLWGGVGLGFIFLIARSYIRLAVFRRLYADDALVWAAWAMTLANAIIWQSASGDMYLMLRVSSGVSPVIPANLAAHRRAFIRALLASYLLFYSTLWAVKLAFLVFFRKLGQLVRFQKMLWRSVLALTVASYFALVVVTFSGVTDYKRITTQDRVRMGKVFLPAARRLLALAGTLESALSTVLALSSLTHAGRAPVLHRS
jgi:hypothetical protein